MRWINLRNRHTAKTLDREIGFHLEELTRTNMERGMTPEEARRRARIAFGAGDQIQQQVREVHASAIWEAAANAAKSAFRFFRKSPSFSLAILLTLALGIGANTAVFSAIDAILLRPLPFPQGNRLVALAQYDSKNKDPESNTAPLRLEDWNKGNRTFEAISGYYTEDVSETSGALPERLQQALVAPRFLEVWGVMPALGRSFTAEEEHFGGPSAVLISDRLWRRHFSSSPDLAGKRLKVGAFSSAVIGVMPAGFAFPAHEVDVWAPVPVDAPYAQSRESAWYITTGRLKPGVTLAQARADLAVVQQQLGRQYPKTDRNLRVTMKPLKSVVIGEAGGSLWLLYGSVTLLLLIACINIAALLLARIAEREHEISVRFALGASRSAIFVQLLSETLALALGGGLLGLLVAYGAVRVLPQIATTLPRAEEIAIRPKILLYTLVCALCTTLLCGLLPALRGARRELARSLALGSRSQVAGVSGFGRGSLQWVLVTAQVAFAVTLLIGAGLLVRSFEQLGRVSSGFDPSHVLTLQISGSYGETADMKALMQRVERTLDALRAVPGVEAAATAAALPGVGGQVPTSWKLLDGAHNPTLNILADVRYVSSGYFQTMRIPLLRGEACKAGSVAQTMLVNRSFAERYLGGAEALGHHLQTAAEHSFIEAGVIKGIVADAREGGLSRLPAPTVYWCISAPGPMPYYLVRVHGEPMAMAQTLRRTLGAVEPSRSVYGVSPLEQHLSETQAENRMRTALLALFAGTAITLACVGLYGTLSYLGRMRQREMGLRLALGASRRQVAQRFFAQGLRVAAAGCAAGLVLGWLESRLLAGMLYGVTPNDPATYAGVVVLVACVAMLASLRPALRAAWINPVQVLRDE